MLERLIVFIFSLLLLFLSAWNYSVFIRLSKEKDNQIQDCHPPVEYINRGKALGLTFVILSGLMVIISAGWLFMQRRRK